MPGYGYKFNPDDDQLLNFLYCKSYGQPLPSDGEIMEVDLYSLNDPRTLFRQIQEKRVYIFTKLKKASKNGKRVDRKVTGNRTWKGVDKGKPILDQYGRLFGETKNFVLMNKMNMKMGFNMKEYVLDERILKNAIFKDYVLCEIKRKIPKERISQPEPLIQCSEINPMMSSMNSLPNFVQNSLVLTNDGSTPSVCDQFYSKNSSAMESNHPFSPSISEEEFCSRNLEATNANSQVVDDGLFDIDDFIDMEYLDNILNEWPPCSNELPKPLI